MRSLLPILVLTAPLATATATFAEEGTFHNFLIESPSIISPSQYYQVTPDGRAEAFIGVEDGKEDLDEVGIPDQDIKTTHIALGLAYVPLSDLVLNLDLVNIDSEIGELDVTLTGVRVSAAYNVVPTLTLGLSANSINGEAKLGSLEADIGYTTGTFGLTYHQDGWEGTLALTTENEDKDKTQNNSPQTIGAHGRYTINPGLILGLSFSQADYSALDEEDEDETGFGLHAESRLGEGFALEFAYLSTSNFGGTKNNDASEFVIIAAAEVAPRMEVGGRFAYETESGDDSERASVEPGLFLSAGF